MKKLVISVLTLGIVAVGCDNSEENKSTNEQAEDVVSKEDSIQGPGFEYDESIQGQWNDIVYRVKSGDIENLNIYI